VVQWLLLIILGLGFTGQRLAARLLRRGVPVYAAVRGVDRFQGLAAAGLRLAELADPDSVVQFPRQAIVAHLIPPLPEPENFELRARIEAFEPRRVVYVSSTAIYGEQIDVDSDTVPKPHDDRGRRRFEEEQWIASGPWTSLILRAAGIYGPGRGVHAALSAGKMPRSAGSGIVSRIHVDDLARLIEAGMFSDVAGAWPVADEAPCSSAEIAAWCLEALQLGNAAFHRMTEPLPQPGMPGRNVNGRRIREILDVELEYPTWRTGIPACLAEEDADSAPRRFGEQRKGF
jgi:nucleoside-diphosphate-sugar epimerase